MVWCAQKTINGRHQSIYIALNASEWGNAHLDIGGALWPQRGVVFRQDLRALSTQIHERA